MQKLIFLTGLLCLAISGAALADWADLGKLDDGSQVQAETVRYLRQGDAVSAVARVVYKEPRLLPFSTVKYDSTESTYHFQCAERKLIVAEMVLLDEGKSVYVSKASDSNPLVAKAQAQPVPVAGLDAMAFAWACNRKVSP